MTELNLTASGNAQERILAYLKEHASEALAEKINRGTVIEKDGRQLLNKKTLDGFMKYACDEARKQAAKGASSIMLDDSVVFGWAIHYFEESDTEGTLYSEDGKEYRPEPIKTTASAPVSPNKNSSCHSLKCRSRLIRKPTCSILLSLYRKALPIPLKLRTTIPSPTGIYRNS